MLAPAWVIDPQARAVTGTHVTIHVAGIVFEGTMLIRIYDAHGTQQLARTVHLSIGAPAQGTATLTVTLTPGRYTINAYVVAIEPVKGNPDRLLDSHPFRVQ